MDKMAAFSFGGGNSAGNHFRLQNVVFDSAGNCITAQNSNLADDWIIDKVDYRHSHVADISSIDLMNFWAQRNTTGSPTGQKIFRNFTASVDNESSSKIIRFDYPDYFTDMYNITSDTVVVGMGLNNAGTYLARNFATRASSVSVSLWQWKGTYQDSILIADATDYPATYNFHAITSGSITLIQDSYYENILNSGSYNTDPGEWFFVPTSGSWTIQRSIIVDQNGGTCFNSVQGASSASGTFEHNTYIAKRATATASNPYGLLMRSESGQEFVGGTNTLRSNICSVYNNLSSDGTVAAVHFDVAATHNQLDVMDNNTYYNCVPAPPTNLFRNLITDGKTLGDVGFGAYDTYVNPQMTNFPSSASPILAFASTKSKTTTKQLWAELLKLNGFNETTRKQETSSIIEYGVSDILTYVRNCVKPSNPLLATSAHDGTSRGAVQFSGVVSTGGGCVARLGFGIGISI